MLHFEVLLQLFNNQGILIDTTTAPRISLHQEDTIWLLEQGSIDIFAIKEKQGHWKETHFFIAEFNRPCLLMPISKEEESLSFHIATRSSSKLWSLPYKIFEETIQRLQNPLLLFPSLSMWVNGLSEPLKEIGSEVKAFLSSEEPLNLKEHATFSLKPAEKPEEREEIKWIETLDAPLFFPHFPEITIPPGQIIPLALYVILQAQKETLIRVVPEEQMFKNEKWKESLNFFLCRFSHYLSLFINQKEEEQKKRISLKEEKESELLDEALYQITTIFEPKIAYPSFETGDNLFKACQIIGTHLGISFSPPLEVSSTDLATQISTICRLSSIRYRRVALTIDWWKKDCGPLLSFFGPHYQPVALIRKGFSYFMTDPSQRESLKLTDQIATKLAPFAYIFYPPLPSKSTGGMKLFFTYLFKRRLDFITVLLTGAFFGLIALFPPSATKILFNTVIPSDSLSWLFQVFGGLVLAAFSMALLYGVRMLTMLRIEGKISYQLQGGLWDYLLELPVHFFRQFSIGDLINRVTAVEQIRLLLSGNSIQILLSGLFSLFYLFMMFAYSPLLSLFTLLFLISGLVVTGMCLFRKAVLLEKMYDLGGKINGTLLQIISGVGKLRVAAAEIRAFSYWAFLFSRFTKFHLKSQAIQNIALVYNAILSPLATTAVFAGFMFFIQSSSSFTPSQINIGTFIGFFVAFTLFSSALLNVSTTLFTLSPIFQLWKRARVILEATPEKIKKQEKIEKLDGSFSLEQVSFRYSPQSRLILDEISLYGNPGEFIAIVGPSGCGKTTIINLLLGFESPEKGEIYYNNKDLPSLDIKELRRQLGIVLQNDTLLSGSIYDNIICGRSFSKEEVDRALELSGFAEDLTDFPMGIHTFLSVGGESLSGGQKQKLLIARALIGNPKILIFDEATSSLDNASQDKIAKNIAALNMTRIFIAHRLSTIRNADRIYVLDKGKVADFGTFHQLETRQGLFAELSKKQKL